MKDKFESVMSPYADRCHDALEPYREGVSAPACAASCLSDAQRSLPQLLTGQGSLKNSEMTTRLKNAMR